MRGKVSPWFFVAVAVFWGCVAAGIATDKTAFFGGAVAVFFGTFIFLIIKKASRYSAITARRKKVWDGGNLGTAKVLSIDHRGGGINDDPNIEFELDVTPQGGEPYKVATSALIKQICIPQIQPGCEVRVRIDPDDATFVVLDEKITPEWYLPR